MALMALNIGGAETHVVELSKELSRMGHEIVVTSAGGVYTKELKEAGIRHVRLPLHKKTPLSVIRSYFGLRRLIKEENFDVVHAHARIPAFILGILQKTMHFRFTTSAHLNFKVNAFWRKISNWGEKSIAVSEDIKQYLIDEYDMNPGCIGVTINGIDTERFSKEINADGFVTEFDIDRSNRHIVYISRMDTDRSAPAFNLVNIAPQILEKFPNTDIIIVGGGDDFARIKSHADNMNKRLGKRAIILTDARTDIAEITSISDVFVGVSRSALEAMSASKAVILSGNQGYIGIFEKDKFDLALRSNFCCRDSGPTTDEKLLSDVMTLLQSSKEEIDKLGAYNRLVIEENFSLHKMAKDYEDMYRSMRPYRYYKYGDVVLSGYYGFGNMGDDSLLTCIIDELRQVDPDVKITVFAKNPSKIRKTFGVRAVNRFSVLGMISALRHSKLLINGGGNLLQNSTSNRSLFYYLFVMRLAKHYNNKIMIYANGIGPIKGEKNLNSVKEALNDCDLVTLREDDSMALVKELGVTKPVVLRTADPVFRMKTAGKNRIALMRKNIGLDADKKYFAISLRRMDDDVCGMEKIAKLIKVINEKYGYLPVFVPMQPKYDSPTCRKVAELSGLDYKEIANVAGGELLGLLSDMEFALSMRLHTLIYACAAKVPPIGFLYDMKIAAFLKTVDSDSVLDSDWNLDGAMALIDKTVENKDAISSHMQECAERHSAVSHEDAKRAIELLK